MAPSSSLPQSSPVKQWLLPTVKGVLQVPHQGGLARHAEEALLGEPTLPDEVHTLLHKQGGQAGTILPLVVDYVLQALPKDPWAQRGPGHTLSYSVRAGLVVRAGSWDTEDKVPSGPKVAPPEGAN